MLMYSVCVPGKTPSSQSLLLRCTRIPLRHSGIITLCHGDHSFGYALTPFTHFTSRGLFSTSSVGLEDVLLQLVKRFGQGVANDDFIVKAFDLRVFDLLARDLKPLLNLLLVVCTALT